MHGMGWISKRLLEMNIMPSAESAETMGEMSEAEALSFYSNHTRNRTGIMGPKQWSDNEEVNRLWEMFGKPLPNGTPEAP